MAWLEMQKSSLRNKGADDLMPPLNKKQRGLWLRLQSEQVKMEISLFTQSAVVYIYPLALLCFSYLRVPVAKGGI